MNKSCSVLIGLTVLCSHLYGADGVLALFNGTESRLWIGINEKMLTDSGLTSGGCVEGIYLPEGSYRLEISGASARALNYTVAVEKERTVALFLWIDRQDQRLMVYKHQSPSARRGTRLTILLIGNSQQQRVKIDQSDYVITNLSPTELKLKESFRVSVEGGESMDYTPDLRSNYILVLFDNARQSLIEHVAP